MKSKIKDSVIKLVDAEIRAYRKRAERKWIQENPWINITNYWYYRYFTNEFENFLVMGGHL